MIVLKTFERSAKLAELKVSYKRRKQAEPGQVRMPFVCSTPKTAEEYLSSVWDKDRIEYAEDFLVVYLNNAIEPLGWVRVATGGLDYAAVDPRVVFGVALQTAATRIIVAHNHPAGSLVPSPEDRQTTRRLKEAGELLRIQLLDHIILGRDAAYSFAEQGLL
jgi:DNA repair protein RadC